MNVDSIGLSFNVWYNGTVKQAALRRPRTNKGHFLPFNSKDEYPAVLIEEPAVTGVIRQDNENKLYFISN